MKYFKIALFIVSIQFLSFAQLTYIKLKVPTPFSKFQADSLFVGAGIIVGDSTSNIIVERVYNNLHPSSCFYLMEPMYHDSARFIYIDTAYGFANESDPVDLGKFPEGTILYFMLKIIDTNKLYIDNNFYGKKLYTGQGRVNVDEYISEFDDVYGGGKRSNVVGRRDNNTSEIGFVAPGAMGYCAAIFKLTGKVKIFGKESFKTPQPTAYPGGCIFSNDTTISFSTKIVGDIIIRYTDTLRPLPADTQPSFYYTIDGSDPRSSLSKSSYTGPLKISKSTTIKERVENKFTFYGLIV